jgi:DNA/RNA endonuclease G (NUC1)
VSVVGVCALADTGTPYPAGTKVEITTITGVVSGQLQDRTTTGWLMLLEPGRQDPTAIPEKAVGLVRRAAVANPVPPPKVSAKTPPSAAVASSDHFMYGRPRVTEPTRFKFQPTPSGEEVDGITYLTRYAFSVGHYDKYKVPAWVAMSWTKANHDLAKQQPNIERPFLADMELPAYARTGKDYQHSQYQYQRGHMARHEDLSGFSDGINPDRSMREGSLMSNIVPQKQKGHTVWGDLEKEHHAIVAKPGSGITKIWLLAGPVFENGQPEKIIGPDKVGAPQAVYKIIAWKQTDGTLTARGYIIKQNDSNRTLTTYLRTIDEIEAATGLDFFPEMPATEQATLEAKRFTTLWGND